MTVKHLIDWKHWNFDEINDLMNLALRVKKNRWEYQGAMTGNSLAMIFQKTSTRTRISFEACLTEMGGHAIYIDWLTSNYSLSSIRYESKYLSRNVAFILARLKKNQDLKNMADASQVPVINGCCNLYHPCQALTDLLTISIDRKSLAGTKLTYIGIYNNVVNSLVSLSASFDLHLTLVCPIVDENVVDQESRDKLTAQGKLTETLDIDAALENADYVYTDTWVNMENFNNPDYADEKQRIIKQMMPYQLNKQMLRNFNGKIMHDMPIHPGYEITDDLVEDSRSIIFDQAENRLEAQKALLIYLKRLQP